MGGMERHSSEDSEDKAEGKNVILHSALLPSPGDLDSGAFLEPETSVLIHKS